MLTMHCSYPCAGRDKLGLDRSAVRRGRVHNSNRSPMQSSNMERNQSSKLIHPVRLGLASFPSLQRLQFLKAWERGYFDLLTHRCWVQAQSNVHSGLCVIRFTWTTLSGCTESAKQPFDIRIACNTSYKMTVHVILSRSCLHAWLVATWGATCNKCSQRIT